MHLLSIEADAKTRKGTKYGVLTGILYLAPVREAGRGNLCPHASAGCADACLFTAGRGRMPSVVAGRVRKSHLWFDDKPAFWAALIADIQALIRKANREGAIPAVRLNGTSDLPWEKLRPHGTDARNVMQLFPTVQFYDYTKWPAEKRGERGTGAIPANYHLTFSLSESNDARAADALSAGLNVAAVFREVPETFMIGDVSYPVVDGDASDLRFRDPSGVIVGLKAKGDARKDTTGFVR